MGSRRTLGARKVGAAAAWLIAAVIVAVPASLGAMAWAAVAWAEQAAPASSPGPQSAASGAHLDPGDADLKHGEDIAMGPACTPAKGCMPCFQCHQPHGAGNAAAGIPRLAGQSFRYLYYALVNYASGARRNATMEPIAKALADSDRRDVAAYFASTAPPQPAMARAAAAQARPSDALIIEGGVLAAVGSAKERVQACANCHGPMGAGLPPVYPYLAGQFAGYLEAQLKAFRSGDRRGDPLAIMADIAKRLSDEQMHAAAAYCGAMQPPQILPQASLSGPLAIGAPLGPPGAAPGAGKTP